MKKNIVFSSVFILICANIFGQSNILNANNPAEIGIQNLDQIQSDHDSFLEYDYIDDRDILWSRIVYEKIDLNERLNFPLLFPINDETYERNRKSLWRVLKENIVNQNITKLYFNRNDNFKDPMTYNDVMEVIYLNEVINGVAMKPEVLKSIDISAYRIKGMWYFDKRQGEMRYRLLGIMPVGKNIKDDDGKNNTDLFWIWYPSIRKILHKELVFNDINNANRISFDQLLVSRRFSSYIYKEDNIYGDRSIKDYKKPGLESILESERIKKEILDFEQDMWNR
ncbi:MAG: gliding motility protein GldN [Flavobacteriaceae bacterium]|jgi:gliding motility associated protien GldN|nr:gliding motility protein GldN [Flavobacteriaceae bacterium]MBT5596242.1 gliding motility protein GldN [Flavobacteriaceae bacterium]MBT6689342.1 gliding motility protein GldN [Flavobacteriaceae bacterium]MBT7553762.1 gliding motility protein GldN [Flavobacteriaceae bacterium]|tara:strand:+ start:240 stop:1085 length:846 start_codon:yes stop_codon:yes gene_type:complete